MTVPYFIFSNWDWMSFFPSSDSNAGLFLTFFSILHLVALLDSDILSNSNDRWVSDLNGDGVFRVKDVRNLLDEFFLPRADIPTRWVKNIPIKVKTFAWKLALERYAYSSESRPKCDEIYYVRWRNLECQSFSSNA
ncbi:hypothetical protein Tco_0517380 [Tanacetum coccineum]